MPRLILAAALMSLGGCASTVSQLPPVESVADQTYRLGPGDELRVMVYGFDSMTNAYTVSDAGTISLPLISTLEVEGLSTAELETAISGQLRTRDLAPRASVSVQVQKFRPFYILGEVQRPGQYPYVPGMTVLTAVSIAGGYTFRANKQDTELVRTRKRVSYRARASADARVLPGDTLMVPEAWF